MRNAQGIVITQHEARLCGGCLPVNHLGSADKSRSSSEEKRTAMAGMARREVTPSGDLWRKWIREDMKKTEKEEERKMEECNINVLRR